tara:strand:+ start:1145 stop:2041 length:897 start_codon:yes stop_codon:yes gene_type:complete
MTKFLRIIPKLDIKGPNLIKPICFEGHRVLGLASYFSELYSAEGADEIFFQDTVASLYERNHLLDILKNSASNVTIPITVAGGIRSIDDIQQILKSGADKVGINSYAFQDLGFIKKASRKFGSQCIVSTLEVSNNINKGFFEPWYDYGREPSGKRLTDWCEQLIEAGVGEIFLSSIDQDGLGNGFDLNLVDSIMKISSVPVVICSGAGRKEHVSKLFNKYNCDGVGIGSMFHYNYINKVNIESMPYNSNALRMGKQIDIGNFEFIKNGYGDCTDIQVEPCSINNLKKFLSNKGLLVRL